MTVSYADDETLLRLFVRWRGSLWKVCYREFSIFITLYFAVSGIYRFGLNESKKSQFNNLIIWCDRYTPILPLTFLLGFYVTSVFNRWWAQFQCLAWPDDVCCFLNIVLPGNEAETVTKRRAAARYLVAACILAWRDISTRVRKRFPTFEHLVQAKVLTEQEVALIRQSQTGHWMLPIDWVQHLAEDRLKEGTLAPPIMSGFITTINLYRSRFRQQYSYAWISFPLVYTQVVTLVTYAYFALCLISRQFIDPRFEIMEHEIDIYFPLFTTLQFLFYVGWLKVGKEMLRPFGEDDDDFELNYIIDRHARSCFALVQTNTNLRPDYEDPLFGEPMFLPHTAASAKLRDKAPRVNTGDKILEKLEKQKRNKDKQNYKDKLSYLNEEEYSNTVNSSLSSYATVKIDRYTISKVFPQRQKRKTGEANSDLLSVRSLGI